MEGATVHIRYHEPGRPPRLVRYEDGISTDGDGVFRADVVGVDIPFYLDVHAPYYLAVTSDLIELPVGRTSVPDIVLDDPVGTVVVSIVDGNGVAVQDATVILLADVSELPERSYDSWLHHDSYQHEGVSSVLGNVRFTGVPPGTFEVEVSLADRTAVEEATAVADQETRITVELL